MKYAASGIGRAAGTSLLLLALSCLGSSRLAAQTAPQNFESQWSALIAAAKHEGQLALSLGAVTDYGPLIDAFTKKFGIPVRTDGGSGSARATRVLAEVNAGRHTLDVGMFSAASTERRLGPAGVLAEIPPLLVDPDVLDTSKWYGHRHWYLDLHGTKTIFDFSVEADNDWVFWYNTKKLTEKDVASLKTPGDFLDPKWKGMMADQSWADPGRLGGMLEVYFAPDAGPEWVRKYLTKMNVTFTSDPRLEETWLVRGRNPLKWEEGDINDALQSLRGVEPIEKVALPMQQGTIAARSSECCIEVFKGAPHPNAAKLFLNWFLTKEGQTYFNAVKPARRNTSLREDVPPMNTVESARRIPGRKYLFRDFDQQFLHGQAAARKFILEAFHEGEQQH